MKVPFSPPRIDREIIDAVTDTLLSGWITTGPRTREFERMLTQYGGHRATHCVNSASSGLELVLRWFGVGPGDEVIVPAYTYAATANVVLHCGATPVMVDCGEDFNMLPEAAGKAVTEKTKVIIPVDIAGLPCDYDAINQLVTGPGTRRMFRPAGPAQETLGRILVLDDAAHSIGARYMGSRAGALTDISVFSFHAVKNLTTAEGGAICLNLPEPFDNQSVYKNLTIKSLHGQTKDALAKMQLGNWRYDIIEAGYKYNMTDIQAAMGITELRRYDGDMLPRRQQIYDLYSMAFTKHEWAQLPVVKDSIRETSYHVYLLRIKDITEEQRDRIIQRINTYDVAVNVHFVPLPMFTCYRDLGYDIREFPNSYDNFARVISLPVYYDLTDEMAAWVIRAVTESVETEIGQ